LRIDRGYGAARPGASAAFAPHGQPRVSGS
jgi:hypothetical protein